MKDKQFYDDIALNAQFSIHRVNWDLDSKNESGYGGISFNIYDMIVVYKIKRMQKLKLITNEEYYELMDLYYNYLKLNNEFEILENNNYYNSLENKSNNTDELEEDLLNRIETIQNKLAEYGLLPENVQFTELIDSQIKLQYKKNSK